MKDLCLIPLYKLTFIYLMTYLFTGQPTVKCQWVKLLQFSADDAPLPH